MCLIIASPKGETIPTDILRESACSNSHGGGFAYIKDGRVHWTKGLMSIEAFLDAYAAIPKGVPHAVHFRVATHGGVTPLLTHPFPITDQVRLDLKGSAHQVLMHNGIYSDWQDDLKAAVLASGVRCPEGPWSDTRGVAFIVKQYGPSILNFMGSSRYLVISAEKGRGMTFFGDWHQAAGLWYSTRASNIAFPIAGWAGRSTQSQFPSQAAASTAGTTTASLTPTTCTAVGPVATKPSDSSRKSYWKVFTDDGRFKTDETPAIPAS